MKGILWRKWLEKEKALLWIPSLEGLFQHRFIYIEESFRKFCCFEIYLRNAKEGNILKKNLGGRLLSFCSKSWERSQKAFHYPINIDKKFFVVATHLQQKNYLVRFPNSKTLWIPAETAFGTGTHATTFLCLRELVRRGPFSSLIDVGTGSGILAIAAAKIGGKKIVAFDKDRMAIQVAKKNALRNHVRVDWRLENLEKFQPKERVEGLVANLFSEMLIKQARKIASWVEKGGVIILSGIRVYQKKSVQKAFSFLSEKENFQKEGWCCIIFQK